MNPAAPLRTAILAAAFLAAAARGAQIDIAPDQVNALVTARITDNKIDQPDRTVVFTLLPDPAYTVGSAPHTWTIRDDDTTPRNDGTLAINPEYPDSRNDLILTGNNPVDDDGDSVSTTYTWQENDGNGWINVYDGSTLPSSETTRFNLYRCIMDMTDKSNPSQEISPEVTIGNAYPYITELTISEIGRSSLEARAFADDFDGDSTGMLYQWQEFDGHDWQDIPLAEEQRINYGDFEEGTQLRCKATPYDEFDWGYPEFSDPFTAPAHVPGVEGYGLLALAGLIGAVGAYTLTRRKEDDA